MESSAEWTANALFSPSKARAQQALAKDWAAVDAWLSQKYGSKRLPNFERNEDVLQTLLALANINESADEQRNYVERVEKTALQNMIKRQSPFEDALLKPLLESLDTESHLDIMAEAAVALRCSTMSAVDIGKKLIELDSTAFETSQSSERAKLQIAALKAERTRMTDTLRELKSESFQPPSGMLENTAEWTRSTKQLKTKVAEYDERLSATRSASSSTKFFDQYLQLLRETEEQHERLAAINTELQAYQDLPTNPKAARAKLEAARDKLQNVTVERERLFEALADG